MIQKAGMSIYKLFLLIVYLTLATQSYSQTSSLVILSSLDEEGDEYKLCLEKLEEYRSKKVSQSNNPWLTYRSLQVSEAIQKWETEQQRVSKLGGYAKLILTLLDSSDPESYSANINNVLLMSPLNILTLSTVQQIDKQELATMKSLVAYSTSPNLVKRKIDIKQENYDLFQKNSIDSLKELRELPQEVIEVLITNYLNGVYDDLSEVNEVIITISPFEDFLRINTRAFNAKKELVARSFFHLNLADKQPDSHSSLNLDTEVKIPESQLLAKLCEWELDYRNHRQQKEYLKEIDENALQTIFQSLQDELNRLTDKKYFITLNEQALIPFLNHYKQKKSIDSFFAYLESNALLTFQEEEDILVGYSTNLAEKNWVGPSPDAMIGMKEQETPFRKRRGLYQILFEGYYHFRTVPTYNLLYLSRYVGTIPPEQKHIPYSHITSLMGSLTKGDWFTLQAEGSVRVRATDFQQQMIFSVGEYIGEGTAMSPKSFVRPTLRRTNFTSWFDLSMRDTETVQLGVKNDLVTFESSPEQTGYSLGHLNLKAEDQTYKVTPAERMIVTITEDDGSVIEWKSIGVPYGDPVEKRFDELTDEVQAILLHNWQLGRQQEIAESAARQKLIRP